MIDESEAGPTLRMVLTTFPDEQVALAVADRLVEEGLAACLNLLAPCRSVYRWAGQIEHATEVPAIIKTSADRLVDLRGRLAELHPYEVPECIVVTASASVAYGQWVQSVTAPPGS